MQVKTQDQEQKCFVYEDKINSFISYLEIGDFATSALILYGFVLYGMTRIGKTATSHLLAGNPLKGIKKDGQDMVNITTKRNFKAKIGNTSNSQTVVPNKFYLENYKIENTPAFIIDTPGYGDTDGILKILANGYFHYRLYSKIKNMKFIVCFDSDALSNTFKDVIETILSFTKSFNNYPQVKNEIWKSCCFLVTKVDSNSDSLQTIKQKFQSMVNNAKIKEKVQVQKLIKEFIQNMIDEDKIFIIKKYKNGQSSNDGHLLQKIDKKVSNWWSREINPKKPDQVSMDEVVFALGKDVIVQTTDSQVSQEQFAELVKIYNLKIQQFIGNQNSSMRRILIELVKDAMGSPDSHNFLRIMSQQVDKFYPKSKKEQKDDNFNEDRQKVLRKLFQKSVCNLSSSRKNKETKSYHSKFKSKNYPLKKMNALKKIQELMTHLNAKQFKDRDIVWLEECQQILFQIIKELSKAAYNRSDKKNIIYKYGYIISRFIEEAKIFVLLLEKFSTNKMKQDIKQKSNRKVIDLFRSLKDFMGTNFSFEQQDFGYEELHKMYIQRFDPENELNKNLQITEEFVNFFIEVQTQDNQTKLKIAKIVLKYSTNILNDKTRAISNQQRSGLVSKLHKSLTSCFELYQFFEQIQDKNKVLAIVRNLSKNLGRVLEDMKQYELSRQVYDSVYFVDSVCRIYRKEIDEMDLSQQNSLQTRLAFCKYLMGHFRDSDAIKLLQQTFEVVQQTEELEEIRIQLSDLMIAIKNKKQQDPNSYETNIFGKVYFQKLKQQTLQQLESLSEMHKEHKDKKASFTPKTSEQFKEEQHFEDVESTDN